MTNFAFVKQTVPVLFRDCARAESYLGTDPNAACMYSRRAVEKLVDYLYELLELPEPYKHDLAARTNASDFRRVVPDGITSKLTAIRKLGNSAVHSGHVPLRPDVALAVVQDLYSVMVWTSYHHSPEPHAVPLTTAFDPRLATRSAPIPRAEVARLVATFRAQDEAREKERAESTEREAAYEAEIAALRAQIAAIQVTAPPDTRDYSPTEFQTRAYIDRALNEADWPLTSPRDREYPVTGMPNASGRGAVDYVLWGADGLPLGIVEAKRTAHSPEIGQQQASLYADCLEKQFGRRPVIFLSNGEEHRIWDDAGGYPPRRVAGFYTADELELLIQRRHTQRSLSTTQVATTIADRAYQVEAIKAVGEAFEAKQRAALLVMATGSGKTRTTIALVDLLQRCGWAKRVLFLADRTALVRQAAAAFTQHLPGTTTVNLVTERNAEGRVYVSTYPTMMRLLEERDGAAYRFGPGYFDLIVIDEAHRSIYATYGELLNHFDALRVGLTATPIEQIDRDTYARFDLESGVPTYNYTLDEAVKAGFLVPPRGLRTGTTFLRSGISYAALTPQEKDAWDALDWGDDDPPDEVGTEALNRYLFNADTVDKVIETLMTKGLRVAGGDRLGKTIIFAKNQRHAEFVQQRFDLSYPEYGGQFARVITHATTHSASLIEAFSIKDKAPHIAISVDMLDTGIDVPEVVNLVFFKAVRTPAKFWQMIGRGTRLCADLLDPGSDKTEFLVLDFCGNLEYFSQSLPASPGQTTPSLRKRLFDARVSLAVGLGDTDPEMREHTIEALRALVAGMNPDNVLVRAHRRARDRFATREGWARLGQTDMAQALTLADLPSSVHDDDEAAKRFDLVILRGQLARLQDESATMDRVHESVRAIAVALLDRTAVPQVAARTELLEALAGEEWWEEVTVAMLEVARRRVRSLVRFIERTTHNPVYTDVADTIIEGEAVTLPSVTPGTDPERFRAKAEAFLRGHLENLTLQRLRRNLQLTPGDLTELEELLHEAGGQQVDLAWAREQGGLGVFVRGLVGLDRAAAEEAFSVFLDGTRFTAQQIRFVSLIVEELTRNGVMEPRRLYESPYTDHAPTGPDLVFPEAEVEEIVGTLVAIHQRALAPGA